MLDLSATHLKSCGMVETYSEPFYNDLDATRIHALALLVRGAKDRRSALHTLNLATIGSDGAPRIRTVVNRGFDQQTRSLRFHTDARAPKLAELRADSRASAHLYDARAKIQLRLETRATIHADDGLREEAWAATRDFSRICYRVVPTPADVVSDPASIAFTAGDDPQEGAENFVAVTLKIEVMEWLYLAHQGHRRARYRWDDAGLVQQDWLVP